MKLGANNEYDIQCGYGAGCLGYFLYNQLTEVGVKCVILEPTSMLISQEQKVKTDVRDALMIVQCLSYGGYRVVYIPTQEDDSVKECLQMRNDHKLVLKKVKQQISTLCLRHGHHYTTTKWTYAHLKWLAKLELPELYREALDEYMASYKVQMSKIERFDQKIEELSIQERYQGKVKRLCCFLGIRIHTAPSLIVESGDFVRFAKSNTYVAYLGLVLGERSSGGKVNRTGITKAGNNHLRLLLIEVAGGICKGSMGTNLKNREGDRMTIRQKL